MVPHAGACGCLRPMLFVPSDGPDGVTSKLSRHQRLDGNSTPQRRARDLATNRGALCHDAGENCQPLCHYTRRRPKYLRFLMTGGGIAAEFDPTRRPPRNAQVPANHLSPWGPPSRQHFPHTALRIPFQPNHFLRLHISGDHAGHRFRSYTPF